MGQFAFEATPTEIQSGSLQGNGVLVRLPVEASSMLSSRGMSMIVGSANGIVFQAAVEPDGEGSHWFRIEPALAAEAGLSVGKPVRLAIEPTKEWREPKIPNDLQAVLAQDPSAEAIWNSLTPAARWDWIRWISYVKQPETRKKHVDSMPSRLRSGKRRPCCFDRSVCTLTDA